MMRNNNSRGSKLHERAVYEPVLDHLGIVVGVCQQIGLIEQIDARVPDTGRTVGVEQAIHLQIAALLGEPILKFYVFSG